MVLCWCRAMPLPSSWGAAERCPRLSEGPPVLRLTGGSFTVVIGWGFGPSRCIWGQCSGLFLPLGCLAEIARQPGGLVNSKNRPGPGPNPANLQCRFCQLTPQLPKCEGGISELDTKTSGRLCQFSPGQRNKTSVYFVAFIGPQK